MNISTEIAALLERFGPSNIMSDSHFTLSADVARYLRFWSHQHITHLLTSVMGRLDSSVSPAANSQCLRVSVVDGIAAEP